MTPEQKFPFPATRKEAQEQLQKLQPYLDHAELLQRVVRGWSDTEAEREAERQGIPPNAQGGSPRRNFPTGVRKAQILKLVADESGLRRADLARMLGLQRARAGQLVNALIDEGLVAQQPGGKLEVTAEGRNVREGRHPETPRYDIKTEAIEVEPR